MMPGYIYAPGRKVSDASSIEGGVTDELTKTVVVLIGNSDNKLTRQEWAGFINDVRRAVEIYSDVVHFSGGSAWDSYSENACWVMQMLKAQIPSFKKRITYLREIYNQDSAAFLVTDTKFI